MRRVMVAIFVTVASGIWAGGPVAAGFGDDKGNPQPDNDEIYVGIQYGSPPSSKAGTDSHKCTWTPAGEASTTEEPVVDVRVVDGQTQRLYLRSCPTSVDRVWVSEVPPKNLGKIVSDMATAMLTKPELGSAPAADTGIVNVDMWLWTSADSYKTVQTRKAWVPTPAGPIWAQATATPQHLVFTPGEPDSQPFTCDGPGQAWEPSFGDDAKSACMYRYLHSSEISPTGTFTATWSIVWSISWTSNASGGATLPTYLTTTTQDITVKEIQALVIE